MHGAPEFLRSLAIVFATTVRYAFLAAVVLLSGAFCIGIVRGARWLVLSLVAKAMPQAEPGMLDLAAAPPTWRVT